MSYRGQLQSMTPEQLLKERDRQNNRHDSAVDRCEELNSSTIEDAAWKSDACEAELKRRGYNPWSDKLGALT